MASVKLEGTFDAQGQSEVVRVREWFNLSLSGTFDATIAAERSFDAGVTWVEVEAFTGKVERRGYETEDLLYRLNCTQYTSGTVLYRISR